MAPLNEIVAVAVAVFGVAWIIADSKISLPFRRFVAAQLGAESLLLSLLECPPCLSFWLGLAAGQMLHRGYSSLFLAPFCTAVSVVLWAYVEKANRA
jgi:hypothetical protein